MTRQKSFKRLVRAPDGEDRRELHGGAGDRCSAAEPSGGTAPAAARRPPTRRSGERTGRGWEEWFDLLDESGAAERSHREIARWVADQLGIEPLAWKAQAVTISYERARGRAGRRAARGRVHRHGVEDGRGAGRAAVRRVRRRGAAPALAAGRASCTSAPRPGRGRPASTGATSQPGSRHVRRQGRRRRAPWR